MSRRYRGSLKCSLLRTALASAVDNLLRTLLSNTGIPETVETENGKRKWSNLDVHVL